jgi:ATP-dependent Clp protease protease subunit
MMTNRFYAMDAVGGSADVYIFGDVTSMPLLDSDVDAHSFASDLAALGNVSSITCHISSYGGEVEEGLAIYNALLAHPADVTTICEGQACSIASVIFMAGDTRIMREASALFVHDCWTIAQGDADDLRKIADDLDEQMIACKLAYMRGGIDEVELDSLLKADTWLTPDEAVSYGFATEIASDGTESKAAASARNAAYERIFADNTDHEADELLEHAHELASLIADELDVRLTQSEQSSPKEEKAPEPAHMTPAKRLAAALNRK